MYWVSSKHGNKQNNALPYIFLIDGIEKKTHVHVNFQTWMLLLCKQNQYASLVSSPIESLLEFFKNSSSN